MGRESATAEHFRRIAEANEAYRDEELARLTIEEACRIAAELLALAPLIDVPPGEDREFVPLSRMILEHRSRRDRRLSRDAERHDRDA